MHVMADGGVRLERPADGARVLVVDDHLGAHQPRRHAYLLFASSDRVVLASLRYRAVGPSSRCRRSPSARRHHAVRARVIASSRSAACASGWSSAAAASDPTSRPRSARSAAARSRSTPSSWRRPATTRWRAWWSTPRRWAPTPSSRCASTAPRWAPRCPRSWPTARPPSWRPSRQRHGRVRQRGARERGPRQRRPGRPEPLGVSDPRCDGPCARVTPTDGTRRRGAVVARTVARQTALPSAGTRRSLLQTPSDRVPSAAPWSLGAPGDASGSCGVRRRASAQAVEQAVHGRSEHQERAQGDPRDAPDDHGHRQRRRRAADAHEGRGDGTHQELAGAQERGCAARLVWLVGQRQRGRVRGHEAVARHDHEEADRDPEQAQAGRRGSDEQHAARGRQDQAGQQDPDRRHATHQQAAHLAHDHDAQGVDGEEDAEHLGRLAKDILDDEWRGGDVGEHRREGERRRQHVAHEAAVEEQAPIAVRRRRPGVRSGVAPAAATPRSRKRGDHEQDRADGRRAPRTRPATW